MSSVYQLPQQVDYKMGSAYGVIAQDAKEENFLTYIDRKILVIQRIENASAVLLSFVELLCDFCKTIL